MPIQHAIWKVGAKPEALAVSKLATEKDLEDMITARPEMISSGWILIGRQVRTSFGGIIDLLAIAPDAARHHSPRPALSAVAKSRVWWGLPDAPPESLASVTARP